MFPQDAITIIERNETGSDVLNKSVLLNGDYYILNISTLSKDNRANTVYCDGSPIMSEKGNNLFIDIPLSYHCESTVTIDLYRTSDIYITYKEANPVVATSTEITTTEMLGSLNMGLSIIITLLFIVIIGFIFNNLDLKAKSKPWLR